MREAKGIGDSYQARQGSKLEIDEALISRRLEVICHYDLPEGVFGDALMWCSGEVGGVDPRPYKDFPKGKSALMSWDANDRAVPPEPAQTLAIKLLPSLLNKDVLGLGDSIWIRHPCPKTCRWPLMCMLIFLGNCCRILNA